MALDTPNQARSSDKKEVTGRGQLRNRRLQLDLHEQALEELDQLCLATGLSSRADAVRYGLRLLQWVAQQLAQGNEVLIKKKGGGVKTVEFVLPKFSP